MTPPLTPEQRAAWAAMCDDPQARVCVPPDLLIDLDDALRETREELECTRRDLAWEQESRRVAAEALDAKTAECERLREEVARHEANWRAADDLSDKLTRLENSSAHK